MAGFMRRQSFVSVPRATILCIVRRQHTDVAFLIGRQKHWRAFGMNRSTPRLPAKAPASSRFGFVVYKTRVLFAPHVKVSPLRTRHAHGRGHLHASLFLRGDRWRYDGGPPGRDDAWHRAGASDDIP
jgi:hypothetical protein